MHNALAHPRLHPPKTRILAIYAPDGFVPPPQFGSSDETQTKPQFDTRKAGISPDACVYVPNAKGQYFKSMGQADRWNRVWLLPEEALFLLERGSMDIRWPTSMTGSAWGSESGDAAEELSIPMSVQAAYACLIGRGGLTLERFSVFTGLKRLGYTIIRAPGWDDSVGGLTASKKDPYEPQQRGPGLSGILGCLYNWINDPKSTASKAAGPVVGCGIHRNYGKTIPDS